MKKPNLNYILKTSMIYLLLYNITITFVYSNDYSNCNKLWGVTQDANGKMLYKSCEKENPKSYFISDVDELNFEWFIDAKSVGICGATSTPRWLMQNVQKAIKKIV